jgi:membrane-bound lytic murein transglycosylase D
MPEQVPKDSGLMGRWGPLLAMMLGLSVACGSGHTAPRTTPEPQPAAAGQQVGSTTPAPAPSEIVELPPAPALDATLPLEELNAERRLAADSAADEAVLEALEAAQPAGDEGNDALKDTDFSAESDRARALTNHVTWDIDVASFNGHDRVQYYLDFFRGPARERFGIWLTRMPRYEGMIRERLLKEGLPSDLVYLALIESGFSNTATSRARAVGMWQFMKGTAKLYGLRVDSWVDERRDPYRATDAAARHLRDLTARFGSLYLAAAAYNAGAGKVSRGLGRLPDDESDSVNTDATFFRLYDTKLLRRETKDYVPKLIAAALIAKQPQHYGFVVAPPQPAEYDSLIVPGMTGLDVIARLADTTVAAIREMNPQYLRLATPPSVPALVRLPPGRGPATAAAYADLPASRRVTFVEHIVARGETMGGIAKRYHVSLRLLTDANPRVRGHVLRIGQQIIVPTGGALSSSVARRVSDPVVPASNTSTGFHRIRRGETLSGLADEYGVTVTQLRAWNALGRSEMIRAGQLLRIAPPARPRPAAEPTAVATQDQRADSRVHLVRRGETLAGLARQYGVSVQALRDANGLSERDPIRAGHPLRIPG